MSLPTTSRRTRPRVLGLLAAASLVLAAGCGSDGTSTTEPSDSTSTSPSSSASESASPTASQSPSESPTEAPVAGGVYYLTDTRAGLRLTREIRDLDAADPASAAVRAMISGPEDPDYVSPWNPDTTVLGVTRRGSVVRVNLSTDARTANIGSEGAALMIQQLVYTVTQSTDPADRVLLLIAGKPAGELWGVVAWTKPVGRADPLDVRSLVTLDAPREGATTASPVTVTGEAAAFEANVPWRVLDADGRVVRRGHTMTSEGMTFSPFSFRVRLRPGVYTVEISEDDPSGGEGGTPMTDDRTFTVQ